MEPGTAGGIGGSILPAESAGTTVGAPAAAGSSGAAPVADGDSGGSVFPTESVGMKAGAPICRGIE